ncbi:signal transduction histidine kinase [Bradyrhizobium diazoefficiens]|uniref:histidine kinase n=1 Tax=Bradyrhizobium diazoefficiens TaxID=1355477 RepID=A0A0E3VXQ8_9BRAD|nr:HAMP domain-containing sensor histidine kinase [Bradyrhizobium diazoefficiens]MBR0863426.1 HAMP domain-containing histidine kinase [Bradyrhizobium diazoefficiens]MBR0887990.1 HAMP domain-containing histidine kinase [Bradyrhizobium diazoefficiens]MBR0919547.1 HAMP domain-containing histidine kinase [Bradyrhizobium diazoefficiens]BAR63085.1 two-component sensor histidine kinase [Bradyrhizobium diazoefficiens]
MRSLRSRLLALWIMLVVSGVATGYLFFESFQQTSNARLARAEETVARACGDLADRYQFFVAGWPGGPLDDQLKQQLTAVAQTALAGANGVEGGFWQADEGSLAYAFPTYEGTGPKTDLPAAELNRIREVNAEALRSGRAASIRQPGRSQVLIVHACPLRGPLPGVTGWTMTRAYTSEGPAYNQLLAGLLVLALTIFGSAVWLARVLYVWSRHITLIETALDDRQEGVVDLPRLAPTGAPELDRLVDALNSTGERLSIERRRATAAERLAALGRMSAGLAHEIRNPIAAMRLKAENALAVADGSRSEAALNTILQQVGRLDALLRDLLEMTQAREPKLVDVDLADFLSNTIETHRDLAAAKGIALTAGTGSMSAPLPKFDPSQMQRALDNLIINAVQNTPAGGAIAVEAHKTDDMLLLRVADTGPGVADEVRERLFEPFVTGRADGTGLGLAIVREIARHHHGDVRLVQADSGAVFEIEVPWQPS